MNVYVQLNKIIEYIEKHIEEKIEYKELAKMIGLNEYTFLKVFSIISNISISEYIRNRRLSNAGQELFLSNEKVLSIAIKYQYNNATSFSRAFEKFHGIKPSQVKKNPEKLKLYTKLHFNEEELNKNIEYKIIEKDRMILYGKYKITTNEKIGEDAPNFYKEIEKEYNEKPIYGMVEYKDKERFNVKAYWVLYEEEKNGLIKKVIPKSKWIQIRVNSQQAIDIQKVSQIFYTDFLPSCKYNFRDLPEIEFYHNEITDFLIPIEN